MSTAELKADLHARIETLDEVSLALANRLLAELKLEELRAQIGAGLEADFQAGRLTSEKVQAAIKEVRSAHPYR